MFLKVMRTMWVLPTTAVGLGIGAVCLPFGAKWKIHSGVIEIHGGGVSWLLEHMTTLEGGALAITLGESVLGRTQAALDMTRLHERVHVKQARRWGPLFIPAYLGTSLWIWWRGGEAYRGNPFEVEAYRVSDARRRSNDA